MDFRGLANQYAQQYGIPPDLFARLVQQESSWRPDVVSSAGAIGLAQLMPGTARELGVDPNDPSQNLEGGARYLRQQYDRFGSWPLALAAYNAGPSRVERAGGVPNISETQNYVNRVWGGFSGDTGGQQMLQPTASSNTPEQRPGLFGRIGNFFGAGDPNAGQPTDPFANLSRAQRTMLGFAALRDAAASLEGRDSNYFAQAMGGFEQARERERLRAQGIFQNQVGALQALAQIEQQIANAQEFGLPVSPAMTQMRDILTSSVAQGGGMPAGGAVPPMEAPSDFTGGVAPTSGLTTAQGAIPGDQYLSEMQRTGQIGVDAQGNLMPEAEVVQTGGVPAAPVTQPAASTDPIAQEMAIQNELMQAFRRRLGMGLPTGDVEFELAQSNSRLEALQAEQAESQQAQQAAVESVPQTANVLQTVQDLRDLIEANPERTTGLIGSALGGIPGSAAFDARATRDTIGANLAFDQLAAMRAASPTGGALGSITERELDLLQSAVANLNLDQSPQAVLAALEDVEARYQNMIRRAYETSEDPAALDRALGGRPSFMVQDAVPAQTGGATHRWNPETGQIEAIR